MKESLKNLCDSLVENRQTVKSVFPLENNYIYPVCAEIFTEKQLYADVDKLENCRRILKEQTGIFSNFRGIIKAVVISMMAVDANPEEKLRRALSVYSLLKERFLTSQYLPVASMAISSLAPENKYEELSERTRKIYEAMKAEHPFLTNSQDSIYAALLALSPKTDENLIDETEKCYDFLSGEFFSSNAVQSLSHILAFLDGSSEEKCRRTLSLYRQLKENGCRYGTNFELPTLGIAAMVPMEIEEIAVDIAEANEYLSDKRGFGFFGIGGKQRLMHAAMIAATDIIGKNDIPARSAAMGGIVALVAAQEAAICAAVAASAAAASASNTTAGS